MKQKSKIIVLAVLVVVALGIWGWQWWTPTSGTGFEFSPILEPLKPFRNRLSVLTGLDMARYTVLCADLPYGNLVGSHRENATLYPLLVFAAATYKVLPQAIPVTPIPSENPPISPRTAVP